MGLSDLYFRRNMHHSNLNYSITQLFSKIKYGCVDNIEIFNVVDDDQTMLLPNVIMVVYLTVMICN